MDELQFRSDLRLLRTVIVRSAIAVVSVAVSHWCYMHQDSFKPASDEHFSIGLALLAGVIWPPFVALGAIFGKARWGFAIGGVLTMGYLAYLLIAISIVGI